jgi:uncharacterized membrane protein YfcA
MDIWWWVLQVAVFAASLLQGATGIGFGVIAGPILLFVLNSTLAIQVSITQSLVIALVLAPSVFRYIDRSVLKLLVYGTCAGIPLGILVFIRVDINTLKLLAGISVAFMALTTAGVFERLIDRSGHGIHRGTALGMGAISGAMSSSLGMPGPVPAAWMITTGFPKSVVRATILMLFIPSYTAALIFQAFTPGVSYDGLNWSLQLLPATILGVFSGKLLETRIDEVMFKRIITAVLVGTSLILFIDLINQHI